MNISGFFIERPIFAAVIAVFITLLGAFAYPALPLAQYPEIAPPTVTIIAAFPGASAETMAETIAAPIEQEINGVEDMLYMRSTSSQGLTSITVTFQPGTDVDTAQVLVQNRVAIAEPRLPEQVRQIGVTVTKQSTDFLMVAALTTTDPALDIDYVGNYANSRLRDRLLRLPGVGGVQVFGGGNYSMRVWIDPDRAAARNLTADEIVAGAARAECPGRRRLGRPAALRPGGPAFELPVQVQGRLTDPAQFGDIVLKTDPAAGAITRLRDVARVELGSQDYGIRGTSNRRPAVFIAIQQLPGSNALETADGVLADLEAASRDFPPGMEYSLPYNPTEYVQASVEEVQQHADRGDHPGRAGHRDLPADLARRDHPDHRHPGLADRRLRGRARVRLLDQHSVAVRAGAGDRHRRRRRDRRRREGREAYEEGLSPREAAHRTMEEISGALIAIGLVLVGVFVPAALISGIPGIFYQQFALTIATATAISTLVSLSLSPALAAILLKPHRTRARRMRADAGRGRCASPGDRFNRGFDWLSHRYGRLTSQAGPSLDDHAGHLCAACSALRSGG